MSVWVWLKSFFAKGESEVDTQAQEIEAKRAELTARQEALAHECEDIYKTAANLAATATTQGLSPEEQAELQAMLSGQKPPPLKSG